MATSSSFLSCLFFILFLRFTFAEDPTVSYHFDISYITASPLGVPQQVIAINGKFPGPTINSTTNNNVVVNVRNKLDENLLLTWAGVQQKRNSWQDGVLGTNCPIPPKWNWTYNFQVKDQIGSYFYFPSLNLQRASGGFGSFIINPRSVIPLPFDSPAGDITILIGDWYIRNHTALRKALDGWNHSGFISECGHLFTCGDGSFGQLGLGDYRSQSSPIKVSHFESRHVLQIACGMRHSIALTKGERGDQVYGFGSRKRGQLGISNEKVKSISLPQSVSGLEEVNVSSIIANGDNGAALSDNRHLYTWGRRFGGTPDACCPTRVISPFSFTQAALGWKHALILTDEGEVLILGSRHGVLENHQTENLTKQDISEARVKKICSLNGIKVVGIASGAEHSIHTTGFV